jgi:hypothetical protein
MLEPDFQGLQFPYYRKTGIGISGSGWVDTGFRQYDGGEGTNGSTGLGTQETKGKQFVQQSRLTLRATPTWTGNGGYFVQAQMELVAAQLNTQQNKVVWGADDAWVRFGKWGLFDVLVGRFQGWEVYHYGMGLDLFTLERNGANDDALGNAPSIYGVTYMYLRQDVLGQGAIHFYPTDFLRFELGGQWGAGLDGNNTWGLRPVGILDLGWVRLKGGAEYVDGQGQTTGSIVETRKEGGGGSLQFVLEPYVEFGFNAAYGMTSLRNSSNEVTTNYTTSTGLFANVRVIDDLLVGGGLNYTKYTDNSSDDFDQWQPYGAVQYFLFKQLFIKLVVAWAEADLTPNPKIEPIPYKNEMVSGRIRLLYPF